MSQLRSRMSAPLASFLLLLGVVFFAAADDPTSDIVIVCPDSVSAGQPISGYATEFTPACYVTAVGPGGVVVPGQTTSPFASDRVYFCYPTVEQDMGSVFFIQASDSGGQRGSKPVLVTP